MEAKQRALPREEIAGSTSTTWLKLIALVFMFCDHAGKMLCGNALWMRTAGRIAFPLYCWCMVVGICRTRSAPKYLLRVLAVGLVSQPLYMVALNHTWREPNIFLTLLLGLAALWGIRERKWLSQLWAPAAALVLAVLLDANYGWKGVLFMLLLYAVRGSRAGIAAVMVAFCLYWGASSTTLNTFFGLDTTALRQVEVLNALFSPWLKLQAMSILALPLILFSLPREPRLPRWLGYAIYPAHLLLLWGLEKLMGIV